MMGLTVFKQKVERIIQNLKIIQGLLSGGMEVDVITNPVPTTYSGTQTVYAQPYGINEPFNVTVVDSYGVAGARAISNRNKIS